MRRIGIAGLLGALAMGFLSYLPVVGWLNLLLGLWFFVGGLIAAASWTRQGDGRRGVMACVAAAGLAGTLLAVGSGLQILMSCENAARGAGDAEFLREYPSGDMTTTEILDYWEAFRVGLEEAVQVQLDELVAKDEGASVEAYRLRQNLSKLAEMKVKMGRLRTDHAREVSSGKTGIVEWMAQTSHQLIQSLREGDTSMVRYPVLIFLLFRALFIVVVAVGGGILGALVFGEDPEEMTSQTPEAPAP